ncbi:TPA: hypothetical protein ACH3X1_001180 [Trebouxia sp. C0004]
MSTASSINCAKQDEIEDLNDTEEAQHGRTSSIPPKIDPSQFAGQPLCYHPSYCCGQAGHSSGLSMQNLGTVDFPGSVAQGI